MSLGESGAPASDLGATIEVRHLAIYVRPRLTRYISPTVRHPPAEPWVVARSSANAPGRNRIRDHPGGGLMPQSGCPSLTMRRIFIVSVLPMPVPETIEASLQLSEAVLVDVGVPVGPVIASIHEKRASLQATIKAIAPDAEVRPLGGRRLRDRLYG